MKSLMTIGNEVFVYLNTQTLKGTIIEIDTTKHFSHHIKTELGTTWCSIDQLEIK